MKTVSIYTDGSANNKNRLGGWAAIIIYPDNDQELVINGKAVDTTNNRMELTAVIRALLTLKTSHRVKLYTDSEYVQMGLTKWGLHKPGKKAANKDLWKRLATIVTNHDIDFIKVKSHSGHTYNERVDTLARYDS